MAQSLNSKVDLTIKATSFAGLSTNGNVMVGNKAFEFYNERNVEDCIQIPWDTIDRVEASVLFNKSISRFVIFINEKTYFTFYKRQQNTACYKRICTCRSNASIIKFWDVFKRGLMYIPNKLLHSNN